jgi:hypothetical protein
LFERVFALLNIKRITVDMQTETHVGLQVWCLSLTKIVMYRQILVKFRNTKFLEPMKNTVFCDVARVDLM